MIHQSTRRRVWDKLLESLGSAEAGGRELDIVIHYLLGAQAEEAGGEAGQMIELLVEEGYPWEVVSELLDATLPPYTTALDAALPGENIVLALHSPRRGRWAAVHKTPGGEQVLVWAASECLARRRAALKSLGANLPMRAAAAPVRPAKPAMPSVAKPAPGAFAARPAPSAFAAKPAPSAFGAKPAPSAFGAKPAPSAHGWSRIPATAMQVATAEDAATQDAATQDAGAPEEGETEWKILF